MKTLDFDWREIQDIPKPKMYHKGDEEREYMLKILEKAPKGKIVAKTFPKDCMAANRVKTWRDWLANRGVKVKTTSRMKTLYIEKL